MADLSPFELPSPHDKLAHKFILDTLKEITAQEDNDASVPPSEEHHAGSDPAQEPAIESMPAEPLATLALETSSPIRLPADKKYFRIGELAELLAVEPYVLRYWEGEFKSLKPVKSGSGHRVYSRKDAETLLLIKRLLHEEKFSIKGARQRLAELKQQASGANPTKAVRAYNPEVLKQLASDLRSLIQLARTSI